MNDYAGVNIILAVSKYIKHITIIYEIHLHIYINVHLNKIYTTQFHIPNNQDETSSLQYCTYYSIARTIK